jgi:hypothetical protein
MNNFNLRNLFILNAIVALAYALALLLGPKTVLAFYGLTTGTSEILEAQLFGSALVAIGLLAWFARDVADQTARDGIVISLFFSDVVGFVVALLGTLAHTMRDAGWSAVVIFLVLALGFGYFQFINRSAA